jgi:hypothetical protein
LSEYLNDLSWRIKGYVRRYIEGGRVKTLVWFVIGSFAIAAIEWALAPGPSSFWPTTSPSLETYLFVLSIFALAWTAVVIAGLIKCGWPGLLMLIAIKWGLFPLYLIVMIYWSCLALHECL